MGKIQCLTDKKVIPKHSETVYTKHHLNHGEEIGVKKLKTVENSLFMGFYAERFPWLMGV